MSSLQAIDFKSLVDSIRCWASELGFQQTGIADINLEAEERYLQKWLAAGQHGDMQFMSAHGTKRSRPSELVPGTVSVICVRMDYLPESVASAENALQEAEFAYISRYALGRDYHKLIRKRLQKLADRITATAGKHNHRVFVDSAPVMEKPLAQKASLGWQGKHTNLINRKDGSFFFLGEIYTDLPLPADDAEKGHCGSCRACIDICPTAAITAPYRLDATRCISYLTIEHQGSIPLEFRTAIGNRIYGCDDCQLVCPWNRFAKLSVEISYSARNGLDRMPLLSLFNWTELEFLRNLEGSPIRRLGYERWQRNIAVALGNAPSHPLILDALKERITNSSSLVSEHIRWALKQHGQ